MLEINIIAFASIKNKGGYSDKLKINGTLKYFIIQTAASAVILLSSIIIEINRSNDLFKTVFTLSIIVKIASVPFHQWFVRVISRIGPLNSTILITWQKIIPLVIVSLTIQRNLEIFILLCVTVSPIELMNTKETLKIIALSSIYNNGWLITRSQVGINTFFLFILLYWPAVMFIILEISKQKEVSNCSKSGGHLSLLFVSNLGRLPPTSGFLAKWLVSLKLAKTGAITQLTLLILSSTINVYIYLRMTSLKILEKPRMVKYKDKPLIKNSVLFSILLLPLVL
jgi:NADH-ubiquinone oxidoreductase chain 2